MVYADFDYYSEKYAGIIVLEDFKRLVIKASRIVDQNINTRLTEEIINDLSEKAQDELKYATCALVDLLYKEQKNDERKADSISIDGVSKTFKKVTKEDLKKEKAEALNFLPIELTRYL